MENQVDLGEGIGIRAVREFENLIEVVDVKDFLDTKIKGKFILIKYTSDNSREADFLDFLLNEMVTYALTTSERKNLTSSKVRKAFKTAVSRFISKSKGEFGELILFHLLERLEGAVQVINKMSIKTSGEMPVYGKDAVHFGFKDNLKMLYLGESKTGKSFLEILKKSLEDVVEHEAVQKFEIELATSNVSDDIPQEIKKVILDYLDPYKSDLSDFKTIHAIFLGYQWDVLKTNEITVKNLVYDSIKKEFIEEIKTYVKEIENLISKNNKLENKNFVFFVIPFRDLEEFRSKFQEEIKK